MIKSSMKRIILYVILALVASVSSVFADVMGSSTGFLNSGQS